MSLTRFGVSMEEDLVEMLDEITQREGYANRSETIRALIRKELVRSVQEDDNREVSGIVTLIYQYGHTRKQVSMNGYPTLHITANLQVHLQHHVCQKVITLQGSARDVIGWSRQVISQRGVVGDLTIMATEDIYELLSPDQES